MADLIRRYPLVSYYILAFGLSVVLGLLLTVSLLFGLLALFGPAAAAFIVASVSEGRVGVARLRAATTRWRVHPRWYLAAIGLPLLSYVVAYVVYVAAGNPAPKLPGDVQLISFVIFFLVIGEEIGWRGFLLHGLLRTRSPLVATAIVAIAWIFWHSPLYFVPGMPSYGGPFLAFAVWVFPLTFLMTFVWLKTESVWLTTLMHGTANLGAVFLFPVTDTQTAFLYGGIGYAIVAVVVVGASWSRFTAMPKSTPQPSPG